MADGLEIVSSNMVSKRDKSKVNRQIDENLRRVYNDALKEDVPDKFLDLINKLKVSTDKSDDD